MKSNKISTEYQQGRRSFLQLAGTLSVGTIGAALGGVTVSNIHTAAAKSIPNMYCSDDEVIDDQRNGEAGLDFQILVKAQDFLVSALQHGDVCDICGDEEALRE